MKRALPWLLAALFAALWWRRGQDVNGPPTAPRLPPPPARLPPLPAEVELVRPVQVVGVPAAPVRPGQAASAESGHVHLTPLHPHLNHPEGPDVEPGKAHLRGRQVWTWLGAGVVVLAAAALGLSSSYNRITVTPSPRQQNEIGLALDGPSTATALSGSDASRAPTLFHSYGCVACHTIPDVSGAYGKVGPNLSHLFDHALIAGVLPNTPNNLVRWIRVPQTVDPNTGMPNLGVSEQDARDIAAYLERYQ